MVLIKNNIGNTNIIASLFRYIKTTNSVIASNTPSGPLYLRNILKNGPSLLEFLMYNIMINTGNKISMSNPSIVEYGSHIVMRNLHPYRFDSLDASNCSI